LTDFRDESDYLNNSRLKVQKSFSSLTVGENKHNNEVIVQETVKSYSKKHPTILEYLT
jgi:hypothetical protein